MADWALRNNPISMHLAAGTGLMHFGKHWLKIEIENSPSVFFSSSVFACGGRQPGVSSVGRRKRFPFDRVHQLPACQSSMLNLRFDVRKGDLEWGWVQRKRGVVRLFLAESFSLLSCVRNSIEST